jgi:hypothetical protein
MTRYLYIAAIGMAIALIASVSALAATDQSISSAQISKIMQRASKADQETRPTGIMFAIGPLKTALNVMDPSSANLYSPIGEPRSASSLVDLVVAHGIFTSNGSHPRGVQSPKGRILELVIDAHTGFVEAKGLMMKVPIPLSRLGHVERIR